MSVLSEKCIKCKSPQSLITTFFFFHPHYFTVFILELWSNVTFQIWFNISNCNQHIGVEYYALRLN